MLSISFRFAFPFSFSSHTLLAAGFTRFAARARQRLSSPRVIHLDPHLAADTGIDHYNLD